MSISDTHTDNALSQQILDAIGSAILVIDNTDAIVEANRAALALFQEGREYLVGRQLHSLFSRNHPVFAAVDQCRRHLSNVYEHGIRFEGPVNAEPMNLSVEAAILAKKTDFVVLTFRDDTIAARIERQIESAEMIKSAAAMSSMLAHEIKNPLSGMRGAAQLLSQTVSEDDRSLTKLIRDEVDRIAALIGRMEVFSDATKPDCESVNIHAVLDHVQRVAQSGFGSHVRFINAFDPSLPPLWCNRDQITQAILNLIKNAAEATQKVENPTIWLKTAYRHGVNVRIKGRNEPVHLPLLVSVADNGPGISADLAKHLFDPFVSGKTDGTGLGLAIVAKIVEDHGGVIEAFPKNDKTYFEMMFAMAPVQDRE